MRRLSGLAAALTLSMIATTAHAEDRDAPSFDPPAPERNVFAVGNVAGLVLGRASFDVGVLVVPHMAPMASLHVQAMPSYGSDHDRNSLNGYGGEAGVRFFTDAHRPAGGFLGLAAGLGKYFASKEPLASADSASLTSHVIALEVGWTVMSDSGFVFAIGTGIEKRWAQLEPGGGGRVGDVAWWLAQGVHPRFLVQVGKAF